MKIHNINDVFIYIEKKKNKKLSQAEKHQIRVAIVGFQKSVQEVFEMLGIDYSDAEID